MRLELIAALAFALVLPLSALASSSARLVSTETSLATDLRDQAGRTQATLSITVVGVDGTPASGSVTIRDAGKDIAAVTLDSTGHAAPVLSLAGGEHNFTAVYNGDTTHNASTSVVTPVAAATSTTPGFTVSVSPATLSLSAGQSGVSTVSVTPVNASSLTSPMFVTVSCSGLPDQSSCTFTPEIVEILPNATTAVTSSMVLATKTGSTSQTRRPALPGSQAVVWALLLPGALGLAGFAFSAQRRRLTQLAALSLVAVVAVLGTTGCNPLYGYKNHSPDPNLPTPSGTFQVSIAAQSSNGVSATTEYTTLVLTVK